jgi:2-polyprenyl-3-methyl-5-hydroxy-6-metoxy-1,4-benzoquinol methylase
MALAHPQSASVTVAECPIPCNLCGSADIEEIALQDRQGRYLRTTICRRCGLVWSNPRPTEEEVRRYYSRQYRLDYKGRSTPSLRHIARSGRGALSRYRDMMPFLRPDDVILDVGAGGGELVYMLRQLGYDARGIEPDERYARHARGALGVPVETGFVQDASFPPNGFSVATLYHSLEHVEDPGGILSRLKQWLRPGGLLIVEVPNVEAVCQAPHHRFHFAHFYSFNRQTLEALGRKAGFEPVQTATSEDGGNLTCVFRSAAAPQETVALPGNCARIVGVIRDHRALSHHLSAAPYVGAFGRLRAYVADRAAVTGRANARQVLDALLTRSRDRQAHE